MKSWAELSAMVNDPQSIEAFLTPYIGTGKTWDINEPCGCVLHDMLVQATDDMLGITVGTTEIQVENRVFELDPEITAWQRSLIFDMQLPEFPLDQTVYTAEEVIAALHEAVQHAQ